jgi:NAD(P)-dependent dehydrogenase (short-subunit alcohol dehydrogenase family)
MPDRKTLLVTGASAGIGAAVARLAAGRGYDLALGYRSDLKGAEAIADEAEALGARVVLLGADLSDPAGIRHLFASLDAAFPRLDGLVNNAGVVDQPQRIDHFTPERLRRMFDTNLMGPFLIAGEAVRRMSAKNGGPGGVIVNISSAAARLGSANQYADYAAAKAGVDILTKALSDEVAAEGIRVAGIRPGLILTDIHAKGGEPGRAERLAHLVPMQRPGTAEEVAEAVLWLLSDAASYVTGTTLDVSGGR